MAVTAGSSWSKHSTFGKLSRSYCWAANPRPTDQESGTLPTELSRPHPTLAYIMLIPFGKFEFGCPGYSSRKNSAIQLNQCNRCVPAPSIKFLYIYFFYCSMGIICKFCRSSRENLPLACLSLFFTAPCDFFSPFATRSTRV